MRRREPDRRVGDYPPELATFDPVDWIDDRVRAHGQLIGEQMPEGVDFWTRYFARSRWNRARNRWRGVV